jgi:hypothetical protein
MGATHYKLLAGAALFGSAAALICDFVTWFLVTDYSPIAETISELGAGPHHGVQDFGLTAFSLGTAALATALVLRGEGTKLAIAVRAAFYLLAVVVAAIGLWNEYGDGEPGGLEIHRYLVWALYPLVGFLLFFAPVAAPHNSQRARRLSQSAAVLWMVLAPFFFIVPDGFDGAYERFLALFMVGSVAAAGFRLFRHAGENS